MSIEFPNPSPEELHAAVYGDDGSYEADAKRKLREAVVDAVNTMIDIARDEEAGYAMRFKASAFVIDHVLSAGGASSEWNDLFGRLQPNQK
jgi:hypothetical protein